MKNFVKMALAAIMMAATFISCSEYDDTELREAIDRLNSKVEALENAVADNVSAIQSMVSLGSVQSCKLDNQTGKAVITLLDGRTLSVDMTIEGLSLISVMEIEGEYYWGVCNNGQTTQLLVGGKPVPVTVTPDLKISENNEWMISVDGGKTWVATGIFNTVQENTENQPEQKPEQEPVPAPVSFFKDVKKEGDHLVLTLMDGTSVKVEIVGEAIFEAAQTAVYFSKEGLEKTIALTEQNLKAYTITEKPEGWKASVDYNSDEDTYSLVITSPADITAAAQSGTIKILGVFNGGQNPEIVSVDVTYEQAFKLSHGIGASVKVTVAENSFTDITGYLLGVMKSSEFNAQSVAAWLNTEEGYLSECHTEGGVFSIEELVEDYDATEAYVVYAVEQIPVKLMLSGMDSYSPEDLQVVEVGSTKAQAGISKIMYDSAYLSLEFNDMKGYFGGFSGLEFWESTGSANVLESIGVGNMTPMTAMSYDGPVNLFPDGIEGTQILPATDYIVWIVPESEEQGHTYTAEDIIIYSFTSAPIVEDQSVPAPSCNIEKVTYGGFTAKVTPAPGAYKTYAAIRKISAVPEDPYQSVFELIDINNFSSGSDVLTVSSNSFSETDEVCIVAVSVTEDGHYGKVYNQTVPLKKLAYSDAIAVSASSKVHGLGDVTVTLSFTGNPSTVSYYCSASNYFGDEVFQDMMARGQVGDAVLDFEISKLKDGNKIEITGLTVGVPCTFYALVKDASGVPSKMITLSFTPLVLMDYIPSKASGYKYGMPQISGTKSGSKYTLQVTKPDECVKYWLFIGDFEYMTGSATVPEISDQNGATDKLVTMQLESVGALELTDSYSTVYTSLRATTRLYMAWLDDKGEYHIIYTHNPNK